MSDGPKTAAEWREYLLEITDDLRDAKAELAEARRNGRMGRHWPAAKFAALQQEVDDLASEVQRAQMALGETRRREKQAHAAAHDHAFRTLAEHFYKVARTTLPPATFDAIHNAAKIAAGEGAGE